MASKAQRAGLVSFVFLASLLFFTPGAHAQAATPTFLVNWKTVNSYVPPSYVGKALPSYDSKITASFELISSAGKLVNVSGQTVYWYLDGTLIASGVGTQSITFPPFGTPPDSLSLEIELPDYGGQTLAHTVQIPLVDPQVVIEAPYPNNIFSTNPLIVTAIPYFFAAASPANLSYSWSVNGQTGSNLENPQEAQITLPAGTMSGAMLDVSVNVKNPGDSTVAAAEQNFTYQSQP